MNKVQEYVKEIMRIAKDDSHGYSQKNRDGNPDYDCSSLVISCVNKSGIPVKSFGASYTGNMHKAFINAGFIDVTKNVNLKSGDGLEIGDVLLTPYKHTEIYTGKGGITGARSDYDGRAGDSSGREICTHGYKNYPWKHVLRYVERESRLDMASLVSDIIAGKYGNGAKRRAAVESIGFDYKEVQKAVNARLKK